MTYKEYLTSTLARFNIAPQDVDLILLNQADIIPNPESDVDVKSAKKALAMEFGSLIPIANISEGGYSINWYWNAIKLWYNILCKETGIEPVSETVQPQVQDMSDLW